MSSSEELARIRRNLDGNQQRMITIIWERAVAGNDWPLAREIHHDFGFSTSRDLLSKFNGSIVVEVPEGAKRRYHLTLLGVFLTRGADLGIELLTRYLGYVKQRFQDDPSVERVTSAEVEAALDIDEADIVLLGKLISVGRFWGDSAQPSRTNWVFGVPANVDELAEVVDVHEYVIGRAVATYDPTLPVWYDERLRELLRRDRGSAAGPSIHEHMIKKLPERLRSTGMPEAAQRLEEAFQDLLRQPLPDPPGALTHAMATLESVMRSVSGEDLRFTDLLKRNGSSLGIRKPLDAGLTKLWGFASGAARHGKEGAVANLAEARLAVLVAAGIIDFLVETSTIN